MAEVRVDELTKLGDGEEAVVLAAVVRKARRHLRTAALLEIIVVRKLAGARQDGEILAEIDRVVAVAGGNHFFVDLLAGANPDNPPLAIGADRFGQIEDSVARNLRHEDLAAEAGVDTPEDHVHALLQGDVESCHLPVRYRLPALS